MFSNPSRTSSPSSYTHKHTHITIKLSALRVTGDILLAARHGGSISGVRAGTDAHSFRVNPLILEKPRQVWPTLFHTVQGWSHVCEGSSNENRERLLWVTYAQGEAFWFHKTETLNLEENGHTAVCVQRKNSVTPFKMLKIKLSGILDRMVKIRQPIKFFVNKSQLNQYQIKYYSTRVTHCHRVDTHVRFLCLK